MDFGQCPGHVMFGEKVSEGTGTVALRATADEVNNGVTIEEAFQKTLDKAENA